MFELTKMTQNKRVKKVISQFLRFLSCSFCCAPLLVVAAPLVQAKIETTTDRQLEVSPKEMQMRLRAQLDEWDEMKPALKRLIKSEQDLHLIIAALDKMSPLASQPNERQLLAKAAFTVPKMGGKTHVAVKKVKAVNKTVKSTLTHISEKVKTGKVAAINAGREMICSQQVAIHLSSYTKVEHLASGWSVLTDRYTKLLKDKKPLYQNISINNKSYIRLLAGNFDSIKTAEKACRTLKNQNQYCHVVTY